MPRRTSNKRRRQQTFTQIYADTGKVEQVV